MVERALSHNMFTEIVATRKEAEFEGSSSHDNPASGVIYFFALVFLRNELHRTYSSSPLSQISSWLIAASPGSCTGPHCRAHTKPVSS